MGGGRRHEDSVVLALALAQKSAYGCIENASTLVPETLTPRANILLVSKSRCATLMAEGI